MVSKKVVSLVVVTMVTLIILLNFTSAESKFVFKSNEDLNLSIPVFDSDNSKATVLISCSITIKNPLGDIIINDATMIYNSGGSFNYIIPASNVSLLGEYPTTMRCDDGVEYGFSTFTFLITPNGNSFSIPQGIMYIGILIISLFFFFLCFFWAIKIPFGHNTGEDGEIIGMSDLKYVKIFLWFMSYLLLIWLVYLGQLISYNFLFFESITNFLYFIYIFLISALLPIIICFLVFGFISFINDKKIHKALQRGLPMR